MSVKDRMQALGGHARSSRQPPLRERRVAGADKSVAADDIIERNVPANLTARDSTGAPPVPHDPSQTMILQENGADSAVAKIVLKKGTKEKVATEPTIAETALQPPIADEGVAPLPAAREDDATSAAKRAIVHEWENWSALHSDELEDPNVSEYFFRHLQAKKPHIVNFVDYNCDAVRNWLRDYRYT
jgi:hypothetical protein